MKPILPLFLLVFITTACFRPNIPISTNTVYPIDVFMNDEAPDRPYAELEWVEIAHQDSLSTKQKNNSERMLYRGISADTKEVLTAQLVLKAQKLGADAMMKVQYKYYTSATVEGYTMRGLAIQYRGD